MNRLKIYACYRMRTGTDDLEFWTTNKKLYDMHVMMFRRYLLDNRLYVHRVLPISQYEVFRGQFHAMELHLYENDPLYPNVKCTIIATDLDMEILDASESISEMLFLKSIDPEIIQHLPKRILAILRQTNYYKVMDGGCEQDYPLEYGIEGLDIDYERMSFIGRCIYYSDKPLIELCSSGTD